MKTILYHPHHANRTPLTKLFLRRGHSPGCVLLLFFLYFLTFKLLPVGKNTLVFRLVSENRFTLVLLFLNIHFVS